MSEKAVKRAYRYRFYPSNEQRESLLRTFGCIRQVYNLGLEARRSAWLNEQRSMTYAETSKLLTSWKTEPEFAHLADAAAVPLQNGLRNLDKAYANFFAGRANYPRFKTKKRSQKSARYTGSAIRFHNGVLRIAKIDEPLDVRWSRPYPEGAPTSVTVTLDQADRWHVSLLFDVKIPDLELAASEVVGVDAGLTSLVPLSSSAEGIGDKAGKVENPKFEQKDRQRIVKRQRRASHKEVGSRNRERANKKLAKAHVRVADRRRDNLHKLTTKIIRETQTVVIEDLAVSNMVKNHALARSISDAAWRQLRLMLEYKADWYGRNLVVVDRWFPSTKTCHVCGRVQNKMPLNVRTWTCACGAVHDRDVNAAKVLEAAGRSHQSVEIDGRPSTAHVV